MTTKQKKSTGLFLGIAVALAAVGLVWSSSFYESTDNAYVSGHVATLSAKVPGLVTKVYVEENQTVKKDEVLAEIDTRDYQNTLDQQEGRLKATEASLQLASKDYVRAKHLFAQEAITTQERDRAFSKFQELSSTRDSIVAQIHQSELNLQFTKIRAPEDGTIGKKSVEPGMVVSEGQPLLAFVDASLPWVDANFKETQLRQIKPGQRTKIQIDSIGGKEFEGVVESISPGTGATFALIPPENATGNFTKIVQRVTVRVALLPESVKGYESRIVPGLSVEAKILVK